MPNFGYLRFGQLGSISSIGFRKVYEYGLLGPLGTHIMLVTSCVF